MADLLEVQTAVEKSGFFPGPIIPDGKIHRFKKDESDKGKSAWYLAHQNHNDKGEVFYVAIWCDWHNPLDQHTFHSNNCTSNHDRKKMQEQIAAAEKKRKAEQEKIWEDCSIECTSLFPTLSENPESEYLSAKCLDKLYGAKTQMGPGGREILVPVRDADGKIWGFQRIFPKGDKCFYPGTKKQENFFVVGGELNDNNIIYVAEGFATGCSIFLAIQKPVVVAFDAGNLKPVVTALKNKYKKAKFVICGDDDKFTDTGNKGRACAEEAAKLSLGKAVFPRFRENPDRWTDFNDLHRAEGIEAVKNQIFEVQPEDYRVYPLGFSDNCYYYITSSNQQVVKMSESAHNKSGLFHLMPLRYWEAKYPTPKGGVDWDAAASDLTEACRKVGLFKPDHIRGSGVWLDESKTVVNVGNAVWINDSLYPLNSFPSRNTYTIGQRIPLPHEEPLSVSDIEPFVKALSLMRWKKPEYIKFMLGWLAIAPLSGALQWRPHLWLTAPSGSGKSWFMQDVIKVILGSNCVFAQGNTTEAGLRQDLGSHAVPVIFDEFETDDNRSADRVRSILELVRQASSESDGKVLKGTTHGKSIQYRIRFSTLVTSVRLNLTREQDKNRFTVVELDRHGEENNFEEILELLSPVNEEYGQRLFSRSVRMIETILENEKRFRKVLSDKYNARFGQQYGALMAGYSSLMCDEVLDLNEIEGIVASFNLNEESEVISERDEGECLDHLVNYVIKNVDLGMERGDRSISELIKLRHGDKHEAALARYGMKVVNDLLCVQVNNPQLQTIFSNTKWQTSWAKPLSRVDGAIRRYNAKFGGKAFKCVAVPLNQILE